MREKKSSGRQQTKEGQENAGYQDIHHAVTESYICIVMGGMRDGGGEKTRKPGGNSTSGAAPPRGGDVWYSDVGRSESNALQSLGPLKKSKNICRVVHILSNSLKWMDNFL